MLKLFIAEQGSDAMLRFAEAEDDRNKVVSALARTEARSAISRLCKGVRVTPAESVMLLDSLAVETRRMVEQPVNPQVLDVAASLIDRHDLRALDAVQFGCAIVSRDLMAAVAMRLIASDRALLEAGRKEGFAIWNPADEHRLSGVVMGQVCHDSLAAALSPHAISTSSQFYFDKTPH